MCVPTQRAHILISYPLKFYLLLLVVKWAIISKFTWGASETFYAARSLRSVQGFPNLFVPSDENDNVSPTLP